MKRITLIGALVASLAVGSAAVAGEHDRHDGGRGYGHGSDHRAYDHGRDGRDYGRRYDDRAFAYRYNYRPEPYRAFRVPEHYGVYYRPHGYYAHRWVRGERLPVAYYARPYVIADYSACGLYGPPRGYHWVRVDGDAVLAAVATGIVLDTVFHVFH
ncbi:MAG TPA: RcnB family protein [Gammaproteobacteria bacterium]|jgi:Ni/Co efflux regulator RcnB|nr:RcnB family protein [Gammaproteobacteria bacterium]